MDHPGQWCGEASSPARARCGKAIRAFSGRVRMRVVRSPGVSPWIQEERRRGPGLLRLLFLVPKRFRRGGAYSSGTRRRLPPSGGSTRTDTPPCSSGADGRSSWTPPPPAVAAWRKAQVALSSSPPLRRRHVGRPDVGWGVTPAPPCPGRRSSPRGARLEQSEEVELLSGVAASIWLPSSV
jgi:hypothetical protein